MRLKVPKVLELNEFLSAASERSIYGLIADRANELVRYRASWSPDDKHVLVTFDFVFAGEAGFEDRSSCVAVSVSYGDLHELSFLETSSREHFRHQALHCKIIDADEAGGVDDDVQESAIAAIDLLLDQDSRLAGVCATRPK